MMPVAGDFKVVMTDGQVTYFFDIIVWLLP